MNENLNLVEILKDCPKGTKLWSPLCGECEFEEIRYGEIFLIRTRALCDRSLFKFMDDGKFYDNDGACVLFPSREQRDWSKFQRPFKDGDVIYVKTWSNQWVSIFKEDTENQMFTYADYNLDGNKFYGSDKEAMALCLKRTILEKRIATEEEKQKLFQAIEDNGYRWNDETKTLEKLIEPKFKVGDRIEIFGCRYTITEIRDNYYITKHGTNIRIDDQDGFESAPNKFDITTLKPFDQVLVRNVLTDKWRIGIFEKIDTEEPKYDTAFSSYRHCIPYNDETKHLLGKAEMEPEYYQVDEYLL